jgi:DinB superfamily
MGHADERSVDPRSLPKTPEGVQRAWSIIEDAWSATVDRARSLPEPFLHEHVDGEWSFVETVRHLIFVTDAWTRRTILGLAEPYHRLGMPPDHRIGQPDAAIDVRPWGIDVHADASLGEALEVREERMRGVSDIVHGLTGDDLRRICAPNPAPGFPPSTTVPVGVCLDVVIGEEWAHHEFATRDLLLLEARA